MSPIPSLWPTTFIAHQLLQSTPTWPSQATKTCPNSIPNPINSMGDGGLHNPVLERRRDLPWAHDNRIINGYCVWWTSAQKLLRVGWLPLSDAQICFSFARTCAAAKLDVIRAIAETIRVFYVILGLPFLCGLLVSRLHLKYFAILFHVRYSYFGNFLGLPGVFRNFTFLNHFPTL